jgi:ketosteroid isomerase-like protein
MVGVRARPASVHFSAEVSRKPAHFKSASNAENRGDALVVHPSKDGRVVILEYEVHGKILATGAPYDNRLIAVVTIENRKIIHWRDYMDSLAAWMALNNVA